VVKLRPIGQVQSNVVLAAHHAQQEPDLLLTDADWPTLPPDKPRRQTVSQPSLGEPHHINVLGPQSDLFGKFTKHGLFGRFILPNAALRELPGPLTDTFRPKQLP
jgi:hypothetical protein